MKHGYWILGLICFVLFSLNSVLAHYDGYWYSYFGPDQVVLESYSTDGYWHKANVHNYRYGGGYYFDYPYRVYVNGYQYTYPAGHYYFEPMYFGGTYYGGPYWLIEVDQGYPHGFYMPPSASCQNIEISTHLIELNSGEESNEGFWASNSEKYNFEVSSAVMYLDGKVEASGFDYPSFMYAGSDARMDFDLKAEDVTEDASAFGYIKIAGQFSDGTFCSYDAIGRKGFGVKVLAPEPETPQEDYVPAEEDTYDSEAFETNYSTSSFEDRTWKDVSEDVFGETTGNSTEENAVNASADKGIALFDEDQAAGGNCNALFLDSKAVELNAGENTENSFKLTNYAAANFVITEYKVYDYSDSFTITKMGSYLVVEDETDLRFKVSAHKSNASSTGKAFIEVKGQFTDGTACSLGKEFSVSVTGLPEVPCKGVNLSVPNKVKAFEKQGILKIELDNPSSHEIIIHLTGKNLQVEPALYVIPPKTLAQRIVEFKEFNEGKGWVLFDLELGDCSFNSMATVVEKAGEEIEGTVVSDADASMDVNAGTGNGNAEARETDLSGLANSAFALLGSGTFWGLVIVILVLLGVFYTEIKEHVGGQKAFTLIEKENANSWYKYKPRF